MSVLFGSVVGAWSKHPFYLHLLLNVSPNRGGQRRAGAVESCTAKGGLRGTYRGVQGKAVMGIRYQTHSPPAPPTKPRGRGQLPVVKVGRCRVTGQAVGGRGTRVTSWRDVQANRTHQKGRKAGSDAARKKNISSIPICTPGKPGR